MSAFHQPVRLHRLGAAAIAVALGVAGLFVWYSREAPAGAGRVLVPAASVAPDMRDIAAVAPSPRGDMPGTLRPAAPPRLVAAATAKGHEAAEMTGLADVQQPDPRGAEIESRIGVRMRALLPLADAERLSVSCTITLCRVTGWMRADPAGAQAALRNSELLNGVGEEGYSPGPDVETEEAGGTAFMFFLNRET